MIATRLFAPRSSAVLAAGGLLLAGAVGAIAAVNVTAALGLTIAALLAAAVALRTTAILGALVISVLVEIVSVGGVTISRLIAPIALVVTFAALARGRARLRLAAPIGWAAAYATWALASGLWTESTPDTAYKLASLAIALIYMVSFAAVITNEREVRQILVALTFAGFVIGLVAIASFFGGGTDRADPATGDPNYFATYQVVALPIVLVLAGLTSRPSARWFFYLAALVLIGSVMSSLSRGGLLTLTAVLLLLLLLPARNIFRSGAHKTIALVMVIGGAAFLFQASSDVFVPRLQAIVAPGETGSGRTNEWLGARTSIEERPILGLGYGGFVAASNGLMQRTPGVDLKTFSLRSSGSEAHNAYISTLAELGVVGLLLFLGLLVSTARLLRKIGRAALARDAILVARISQALLLGLVAWGIASFFLSTETSRPLWILIGLSLALWKLVEGPADPGVTTSAADPSGRA